MSCCLKGRDKYQYEANNWRQSMTRKARKDAFGKAIKTFFITLGCYAGMLGGVNLPMKAFNITSTGGEKPFPVVTSSTPQGTNYFIDKTATETLSSDFNLGNCTSSSAFTIGLITENGLITDPSYLVLKGIFDDMNKAYQQSNPDLKLKSKPFTDAGIDSYVKSSDYIDQQICFGVGLTKIQDNEYDFTLRFYPSGIPSTNIDQVKPSTKSYDTTAFTQYGSTGYLQLMASATKNLLEKGLTNNVENVNFSVAYMPMNTGEFKLNEIALASVPTLMAYVFVLAGNFANDMIDASGEGGDAERRVDWMLSRMGNKVSSKVLASQGIFWTWSMLAMIIVVPYIHFLCAPNIGLLVVLAIFLCFILSDSFFKLLTQYGLPGRKGTILRVAWTVVQFGLMILQLLQGDKPQVAWQIYAQSIFPLLAIFCVSKTGIIARNLDQKVTIGTLFEPVVSVKVGLILVIMLCMAVFWALLIVYIWPLNISFDPENPLPWYYPFTADYWRGNDRPPVDNIEAVGTGVLGTNPGGEGITIEQPLLQGLDNIGDNSCYHLLTEAEKKFIEEGTMELPMKENLTQNDIVQIKGLVKRYGDKTAVNNLNLTMYRDEILVLLGHNGAGKTTTISMLTGQIKPNEGFARAFGKDLLGDQGNLYDFIGVCTQDNILLESLTVQQNLEFFCKFKGVPKEYISEKVNFNLEKFNLAHKANSPAKDLSGGQKRKLQLCISLLGDAQFILLDEPTSGMDPTARRETWKLIEDAKKGRLIILTTHYMDEAEYLADRVAIVSNGQLKCVGSSLFLKNKYGTGFILQVDKLNADQDNQALTDMLQEKLADEQIVCNTDEAGQTVIELPRQISDHFTEIFEAIDADLDQWNIKRYNLRVSSLEEVFIEIGEQEQREELKQGADNMGAIEQARTLSIAQEVDNIVLEKYSCYRACKIMNKYEFKNSTGQCCTTVCVTMATLMFVIFQFFFAINLNYQGVNFSDVNQVFQSVNPQTVPVNQQMPNGVGTSTGFFKQLVNPLNADYETDFTFDKSVNETLMNYSTLISKQAENVDFYGSYLLYNAYDQIDAANQQVDLAIYANISSSGAVNTFGALGMQQIARNITGIDNFKVSFTDKPLKQNLQVFAGAGALNVQFFLTIVASFTMSVMIFARESTRHDTGYRLAILQRGSSNTSYFFGQIFNDAFYTLIFGMLLYFVLLGMNVQMGAFWLPVILFAIAESLWVQTWLQLFKIRCGCSMVTVGFIYGLLWLLTYIGGQVVLGFMAGPNVQPGFWIVSALFAWSPSMNFYFAMASMFLRKTKATQAAQLVNNFSPVGDVDPYGKYGCQYYLIYQFGCIVVYASIIGITLSGWCKPKPPAMMDIKPVINEDEDPLVKAERELMNELINKGGIEEKDYPLKVSNLVKQYMKKDTAPQEETKDADQSIMYDEFNAQETLPKPDKNAPQGTFAVKGTSFRVKKGEVFTLLGVNGAGKSTTFKCLVGLEPISSGNVILNGDINLNDTFGSPELLHGVVGYCPQTDCIAPQLSVRKTLEFFASLVGYPDDKCHDVATKFINNFALSAFENTAAGSLSGGNKRKLCCAMAMIGNPSVIFIDEATTGVDPASRRVIWQGIRSEGRNSAVVYTTHAMEEAEAISNKMTIMVRGLFQCYGTLQDIKQEFGEGFEIYINFDTNAINQNHALAKDALPGDYLMTVEEVKEKLNEWTQVLKGRGGGLAETKDGEAGQGCTINFAQEFGTYGLLRRAFQDYQRFGKISVKALEGTVLLSNIVQNVLLRLAAEVGAPCTLVSLEGNYAHIKTTRTEFQPSIGYLHAYLESIKRQGDFPIKEYSCSQATLEQIFDNFAQEVEFAPFNRQSIVVQKKSLTFDEAPARRLGGNKPSIGINESVHHGHTSARMSSNATEPLLEGNLDQDE